MEVGIIDVESLSIKFECLIPSMWVLLLSWSHGMIWAAAPPPNLVLSISGILQLLYLLHHPTTILLLLLLNKL